MSKRSRVRVDELEVGSERVLVVSYPLDNPGDPALEEQLSPAEREVARMVIQGLSNAAIATRRGTSVRTVANQVAAILRKLNVDSRRSLMASALVMRRS